MKVAVIGSGGMASIYCDLIHESRDARLEAVLGNTPEKAKALGDRFGIPSFHSGNLDGLFRGASDIDAYILATPEWVRVSVLERLIEKNKPILIEKPLGVSSDDLKALRALSQDERKNITVAHSLRMSPRFCQVEQILLNKQIGEVRHIYSRRNPSLKSVERVLGRFDLAYWLTCHDVDLIRWFLKSEVESVYAITRSKLLTADDYLIVHLKFKNGVDVVHEVSWCSPPISADAPTCMMTLKGTKGVIEVNDSGTGIQCYTADEKVTSPDTYEHYPIHGQHYGVFKNLVDLWIRNILEKQSAYPGFSDALAAVEVCEKIAESVRTGLRVSIST